MLANQHIWDNTQKKLPYLTYIMEICRPPYLTVIMEKGDLDS
jgi:hypothetical protein